MRRNVTFALLAVSALIAVSALVVTVGRNALRPAPLRSTGQDLAAPLAPESATDFAAAMPDIDELRHRRGSVLDGTLLESAPEAETPSDNSYVELLRREARRLDGIAADFNVSSLMTVPKNGEGTAPATTVSVLHRRPRVEWTATAKCTSRTEFEKCAPDPDAPGYLSTGRIVFVGWKAQATLGVPSAFRWLILSSATRLDRSAWASCPSGAASKRPGGSASPICSGSMRSS